MRGRSPWAAASVVGLLALTAATPALAAKPAVLVLELETQGLPDGVGEALDAAMRAEVAEILGSERSLLPKPALDFDGMKLAAGCTDEGVGCLVVIGRTLGAAQVLQAVLAGSTERARASFTLVEVETEEVRRSAAELTSVDAASAAELRVHVAAAFGVRREPPTGAIVLSATVDLGGAELLLDDKKIPPSLLSRVPPGEHRLELRKSGYETFIWVGAVRPGRPTQVAVNLTLSPVATRGMPPIPGAPVDVAPPPDPAPGRAPAPPASGRLWTWVLGGAAVVAAGVGTAFGLRVMALESDLTEASARLSAACNDDPTCVQTRSGEQTTVCAFEEASRDCDAASSAATISTLAWVAAGGLAVGAVTAWFLEAPPDEPPAARVEVTAGVAPLPGGGAASVQLRF